MKFLFSTVASGKDESEAIENLQNAQINPADMDIETIEDEDGNKSFTVVGFYDEVLEKYAGHHFAKDSVEAEKQAEELGVTVCGVFEGEHKAVDNRKYLK